MIWIVVLAVDRHVRISLRLTLNLLLALPTWVYPILQYRVFVSAWSMLARADESYTLTASAELVDGVVLNILLLVGISLAVMDSIFMRGTLSSNKHVSLFVLANSHRRWTAMCSTPVPWRIPKPNAKIRRYQRSSCPMKISFFTVQ